MPQQAGRVESILRCVSDQRTDATPSRIIASPNNTSLLHCRRDYTAIERIQTQWLPCTALEKVTVCRLRPQLLQQPTQRLYHRHARSRLLGLRLSHFVAPDSPLDVQLRAVIVFPAQPANFSRPKGCEIRECQSYGRAEVKKFQYSQHCKDGIERVFRLLLRPRDFALPLRIRHR